jgi:hypothetical protein
MRFMSWAAAIVAALGLLSPVAQANTVSIFTGASLDGTLSDLGVSVTFVGYTAPGATSSTQANTTTVHPANPQTLVGVANTYFSTNFVAADETRTLISGGPLSLVLDIETLYFSLTLGGNQTAFFRNDSGGALHLTYTGLPSGGNGVSHYSEYGDPLAVPGPIVGAGLPGLMMALGGLVILARRRRHQSDLG